MAKQTIVYTRLFQICDLILMEFVKQNKHTLTQNEIEKVATATPGEYYACKAYLAQQGYIDNVMDTQPAIKPLGEFFIKNGGFKKKLEDDAKKDQYAASQHLFNKLIVWLTIAIGAATIWQACGQDIKSALRKKPKTSKESKLLERDSTSSSIVDDSISPAK
jgi:hypothetical protein